MKAWDKKHWTSSTKCFKTCIDIHAGWHARAHKHLHKCLHLCHLSLRMLGGSLKTALLLTLCSFCSYCRLVRYMYTCSWHTRTCMTSCVRMFLVFSQWPMHLNLKNRRMLRGTGRDVNFFAKNKLNISQFSNWYGKRDTYFYSQARNIMKQCTTMQKRQWWLTAVRFCQNHHLPIKSRRLRSPVPGPTV